MSSSGQVPQEIVTELFSRAEMFFGPTFAKVQAAHVVVVGLGGVGSHAVNMLVRSGVGSLRLIDFDNVTLSSLNRHATACMQDVGVPKSEALCRALRQVVPWVQMESVPEMFRASEAMRLICKDRKPDFVLDCIDDVNTKAELLAFCLANGLRVITSMGAGGKADPTKLRIGSLSDCVKDPLASKIKWKLKKHGVSPEEVIAVYSCEKPLCNLMPLDDEMAENPQDFGAAEYLRLRVMPVLGTSPSVFGQAIAAYVLCTISELVHFEPDPCERMSKNLKVKLTKLLAKSEKKRFASYDDVDLDDEDLEFAVQTVWHARCAVTGKRFGGHDSLELLRWDEKRPLTPSNLVLVCHTVASAIENGGIVALSDQEQLKISRRLKWAEEFCKESSSRGTWTVDGLKPREELGSCRDGGLGLGAYSLRFVVLSSVSFLLAGIAIGRGRGFSFR